MSKFHIVLICGTACLMACGHAQGNQGWMVAQGAGLSGPQTEQDDNRRAIDVLEGRVSYYHDSLAGNHTANGDIYDPRLYTAASRTLAFGTLIRVVRKDTGASVIVRINDRGPFGNKRRILDVSRAAAEKLEMLKRGVVEVRAEVLRYGDTT